MNFPLARSVTKLGAVTLATVFLTGCIHHHRRHDTNFRKADYSSRLAIKSDYHSGDELSETDVIGADRGRTPTEADIQNALLNSGAAKVNAGDSILVLQSGEPAPDERLVKALNKHFRAIPFTGIRRDWRDGGEGGDQAAKALRFAAAQAGAQKLLCYWGELEVAHHNLSTKTITWLPMVDVIVPDQLDRVRIHLRVAVVDVKTGGWTVFRTEPVEATAATTGWGRNHVETPEINALKRKSYESVVSSLLAQRTL